MLRACILQGALLSTPGSHEEEQEAWHSAKSDNQVQLLVQHAAPFQQLLAKGIRADCETGQ